MALSSVKECESRRDFVEKALKNHGNIEPLKQELKDADVLRIEDKTSENRVTTVEKSTPSPKLKLLCRRGMLYSYRVREAEFSNAS